MFKARIVFPLTCFIIWNAQVNVFVSGVDECATGLKSCPANSMCNDTDVNVNGTAKCTCNSGYTGNETMCKDINECNTAGICPGDNVQCENTDGSFLCLCVRRDYVKINGSCFSEDDCRLTSGICHDDADCLGSGTSFECRCKAGYTGDGKNCSDVDECAGQNVSCDSDRTCFNLPGSYECGCRIIVDPSSTCQAAQEKVNNKVNNGSDDDDDDDDDNTVTILVSITIVLLVLCLIALIITIVCVYRMKKGY